jgi:hypothetical protein
MRKRSLTLALTCAGIVLLLLATLAVAPWQGGRQEVRLPNGSVLVLEGVTYGREHRVVFGGAWQRLLHPLVPPAVQKWLGCQEVTLAPTRTDRLCFWVRHSRFAPRQQWNRSTGTAYSPSTWDTRAVPVDEHGCEGPDGRLVDFQVLTAADLRVWGIETFPRREQTVKLRIYERTPQGWARAAEFTAGNPTPGRHPQWEASPPPLVKRNGDLDFTLTSFETGLSAADPKRAAGPGEEVLSRAAWQVRRSGLPAPGWRLLNLQISDATGNDWAPYLGVFWTSQDLGAGSLEGIWHGPLWADEHAWKLRAEFSRLGAAVPDRRWDLSGVRVPAARPAPSSEFTTSDGLKVRLILITNRGQPSWSRTIPPNQSRLQVWVSAPAREFKLALLGVTDQQGRPLRVPVSAPWPESTSSFRFLLPAGVTRLNLRIGGYRSRFVEFLASPARRADPAER